MKHFKTISELHQFWKVPPPLHPLISVVDIGAIGPLDGAEPMTMALDFYAVSVKRMQNVNVKYGQHPFDFNEGILYFTSPGQVFSVSTANQDEEVKKSGWVLNIHPDFIWNTPLAKTIKQYSFWDYSLHEALFLSAKEEAIITNLILTIQQECEANIDQFSKPIIISHLESLLHYADRFYHRQFITREKANHQVLNRLETLLDEYFNHDAEVERGLPTVRYVAEALNLSPKYLSNLLRVLTGQTTQQHIHEKLIEKAKERLSTTNLSISEIAHELGFEHLPSFSKLFKTRTNLSPLAFRASFN